jgi:hypothetical protein
MSERIRKVDYYKIEVANKSGEGARVLEALRKEGVNLLAFTGFPRGRRAQIDVVPENTAAFKATAKRARLKLGPKKIGFLVQGEDRIGAIADIMARLGDARINVTAIDAVCGGEGRYGAIFWVKPPDVAKAARVLGASKF